MKKYLLGFGLFALVAAFPVVSSATVERVPGPWGLTAPSPIVFSCGGGSYAHTLNNVATDSSTGDFSGDGTYDANTGYTWDIIGNISGDSIAFNILYDGLNPGYTLNGVGTIAPDGSVSGTTDGNCQTFSMPAGSASQFTGNHGQWVSSQTDKKDAAQSRVGMPVQSKGHTK